MRILVAAPCVYPVRPPSDGGYGGMERLAALISTGLASGGHSVTLVGGRGSRLPGMGVEVLPSSDVGTFGESEWQAKQEHSWALDHIDAVLDLSHSHFFRTDARPGISWIWHDPKMMTPPVPMTNVAALSGWQADRFMESTQQSARVIDCICADEAVCFYDSGIEISDRYISIGILDKNKGQAEAALLARELGIELDVVGKPVDRDIVNRVLEIERETEGRIKYHGEVFGDTKVDLLKRSRGLIYTPNYPEGRGEAHSHKVVEALMCGKVCFLKAQGATEEIFGGMSLDLAELSSVTDYSGESALSNIATSRWSVPAVTGRLVEELEAVIGGKVW